VKRLALLSVIVPILVAGFAYAESPRVRCKPTCPAANRHVNGHPKTHRQAVLPNTSNRNRWSARQKFELFPYPAASALSESLVSNLDPAAKINWASNCHSSPSQFQLDSDRCRRFARAVLKRERKSNNFGKHVSQNAIKIENAYAYCMERKGYNLVPIEPATTQPHQELPPSKIPIRDGVRQVRLQPATSNQPKKPVNYETPPVQPQPAIQNQTGKSVNKELIDKIYTLEYSYKSGEISTEEFVKKRKQIVSKYSGKGE